MLDEPIRDPRLLQAMEACRPDSEDLADPELAFLADQLAADPGLRAQFDRLKAFDRAVAEAFADVPVPESLEQRILTRIQPQTQRSANQPAENIAPETAPTPTADSAETLFSGFWLARCVAAWGSFPGVCRQQRAADASLVAGRCRRWSTGRSGPLPQVEHWPQWQRAWW